MRMNGQPLNSSRIINLNSVITALIAATLYGISSPISKLLLLELPPVLLAALLYLGAGLGMLLIRLAGSLSSRAPTEAKLTKKELPYVIAMILLDIGAPILLMLGLMVSEPASVSLLNNFEIVATSFLALFLFKEAIGRRMWIAIGLISLSSIVLSVEGAQSLNFSIGSLLVILACCCWGLENNCTRMLSMKDPLQIVIFKGIGSGVGALLIAFAIGQVSGQLSSILFALLIGFIAYGLSIYFYIKAQRILGAARTSAYYATAPFIGVLLSWLIFKEGINTQFLIALVIMLVGSYFAMSEVHNHNHDHEGITHEHKHNHSDGHHTHTHIPDVTGEHSHVHIHEPMKHNHVHTPDTHHNHMHLKQEQPVESSSSEQK